MFSTERGLSPKNWGSMSGEAQGGRYWGAQQRQINDWSNEETDDPLYPTAVTSTRSRSGSRDGLRVELVLYAGNNLDKARRIFERTTRHRPRIRLTIRQRMCVLDEWPRHETLL
jgi:hypothetical protein